MFGRNQMKYFIIIWLVCLTLLNLNSIVLGLDPCYPLTKGVLNINEFDLSDAAVNVWWETRGCDIDDNMLFNHRIHYFRNSFYSEPVTISRSNVRNNCFYHHGGNIGLRNANYVGLCLYEINANGTPICVRDFTIVARAGVDVSKITLAPEFKCHGYDFNTYGTIVNVGDLKPAPPLWQVWYLCNGGTVGNNSDWRLIGGDTHDDVLKWGPNPPCVPTASPTRSPMTDSPTFSPDTLSPSQSPSASPDTFAPTHSPSVSPLTSVPSVSPPSNSPMPSPSVSPTLSPTYPWNTECNLMNGMCVANIFEPCPSKPVYENNIFNWKQMITMFISKFKHLNPSNDAHFSRFDCSDAVKNRLYSVGQCKITPCQFDGFKCGPLLYVTDGFECTYRQTHHNKNKVNTVRVTFCRLDSCGCRLVNNITTTDDNSINNRQCFDDVSKRNASAKVTVI